MSSLAAKQGDEHHHRAQDEPLVTLGVDTQADIHVAVALDHLGARLGATEIPTNRAGSQQLLEWVSQLGVIDRVGIEGTGSYGAGLFRWLRARGITDAEGAARSVISGRPPGSRSPRTATWR